MTPADWIKAAELDLATARETDKNSRLAEIDKRSRSDSVGSLEHGLPTIEQAAKALTAAEDMVVFAKKNLGFKTNE